MSLLPADKGKTPVIRSIDDIELEKISWLWFPYIPLGKITILQGDPGNGKTMLALDIAAKLSAGEPLPFSGRSVDPVNIIYQTAEDGYGDTIKPRLISAGADCSRILFIEEKDAPLSFADNRLESAIRSVDAGLLILDPLSAYIGNDVNLNHAIDVRKAFRLLYELADRTKCAVLVVAHINKMKGISSLYRTSGSTDVAGSVRSIIAVGKRRNAATERILVHVKTNLQKLGPSLIYELTDHIEWKEQSDITADDLFLDLNPASDRVTKRDIAKQELLELLMEKDQPQAYIKEYFENMGISFRTVQDAQKELGIKPYRSHNQSFWPLPATMQQ